MMNKKFVSIILALFLLPVFVSAATYYVDKDSRGGPCNNNNAGTNIAAPWCTIAKATATVKAGDTVYIREGVYAENDGSAVLRTHSSGDAANGYITFQNYNNEAVILRDQPIGIYNSQSYIKFIGLRVENLDYNTSIMQWGMRLDAGNHVIVQYCTVYNLRKQDASRGIQIGDQASYYQILNNTVMYVGYPRWLGTEAGDQIVVFGDYNLIQGNKANYGGHGALWLSGNFNVVRYNNFRGSWGRPTLTLNSNSAFRNLIEWNILWDAHEGHSDTRNPLHQQQAPNTIFRRNLGYLGDGPGIGYNAGIDVGTPNVTWESSHNRFYNNVIYDIGNQGMFGYRMAFHLVDHNGGLAVDNVHKNNICYSNYEDGVRYDIYAYPEDNTFVNNTWNPTDPKFVNEANYDFHLQSTSPAIDKGGWLTTITSSTGSGTTFTVADASYFMDGWGIIEGDAIQLQGQATTARITNVNYDTNTITVNRSLSWSNGQGISQPYSGIAPDIGAYEYSSATPPPPPSVPGDLDNDNDVDLQDLIIIMNDFGKTSGFDNSKSDTNADGIVDIFDVVYVASRFT
jgi:hypothetical protein